MNSFKEIKKRNKEKNQIKMFKIKENRREIIKDVIKYKEKYEFKTIYYLKDNSKLNQKHHKEKPRKSKYKILNIKFNLCHTQMNLILLYYKLINLFVQTLSVVNILGNIISQYSYINLKLKGNHNINIYGNNSNGINCHYQIAPLPDEIYINGINQSIIKTSYDFNETENEVKLIWKNNINSTSCMFLMSQKIVEIDLSNFDASQVTNLHAMFYGCSSLISVIFSKFNSPQAIELSRMFYNCPSLISLDLPSFAPLNVEKVYGIFDGCSSLKYINLENLILPDNLDYSSIFNQISEKVIFCSKNKKWNEILNGCEFINCNDNISEIDNNNQNNQFKCYKKCSNEYINKNICENCGSYYYQIKDYNNETNINCYRSPDGFYLELNDSNIIINKCFSTCKFCEKGGNSTNHNCIECSDDYRFELNMSNSLNCYNQCSYYYFKDSEYNKIHCTQNLSCPERYNKLIIKRNECIDDCSKDPLYKYEYEGLCLQNPNESTIIGYNREFTSNDIIITDNFITNEYFNDMGSEELTQNNILNNKDNLFYSHIIGDDEFTTSNIFNSNEDFSYNNMNTGEITKTSDLNSNDDLFHNDINSENKVSIYILTTNNYSFENNMNSINILQSDNFSTNDNNLIASEIITNRLINNSNEALYNNELLSSSNKIILTNDINQTNDLSYSEVLLTQSKQTNSIKVKEKISNNEIITSDIFNTMKDTSTNYKCQKNLKKELINIIFILKIDLNLK